MAYELGGDKAGFEAAVDLSTVQFRVIKLHTVVGQITSFSAAGDVPFGVLQNTPSANEGADVTLLGSGGISKASADAAIGLGSYVMTSADGQVTSATVNAGSTGTSYVVGLCLEAATAANDVISIALIASVNRGIA